MRSMDRTPSLGPTRPSKLGASPLGARLLGAALFAFLTASLTIACSRTEELPAPPQGASPSSASPTTTTGVKITRAELGDVTEVVRRAREQARAAGRTLVVYVGATWCEPCRYFHEAAGKGELDQAFPNLTLLEFDLDADRGRLERAGYLSNFVPLFVLPGDDGRPSSKRFEGSVKGPRAVADITPKLHALLGE